MRPVTVSPLHLPMANSVHNLSSHLIGFSLDTQLTLTLNSYTSLELDQSRT